jgi:hypothetical protein
MKAPVPFVAMGTLRVSQQGRGPKKSKMRQISRARLSRRSRINGLLNISRFRVFEGMSRLKDRSVR